MLTFLAQAAVDSIGAGALGLAGGGISVVLLAIVQGYFESVQKGRAHDLDRLRLEHADAQSIAELADAIVELHQWARLSRNAAAATTAERGAVLAQVGPRDFLAWFVSNWHRYAVSIAAVLILLAVCAIAFRQAAYHDAQFRQIRAVSTENREMLRAVMKKLDVSTLRTGSP